MTSVFLFSNALKLLFPDPGSLFFTYFFFLFTRTGVAKGFLKFSLWKTNVSHFISVIAFSTVGSTAEERSMDLGLDDPGAYLRQYRSPYVLSNKYFRLPEPPFSHL